MNKNILENILFAIMSFPVLLSLYNGLNNTTDTRSIIMTWKFLWQLVFILGMGSFIIMFIVFTVQGYRDSVKLITTEKNNIN